MLLLSTHPVLQFTTIALSWYVFFLGFQRFRSKHLHKQAKFRWKRHVRLGTVSLCALSAGIIGGLTVVRLFWHRFLVTGLHGKTALFLIPLILFGLGSGLYMNAKKGRRRVLPLLHALNNLLLLLLAFFQIYTGFWVYRQFVLG